ncbi:GAF domain-containing protein [Alsobacter sp. SYSU M60028]|uniref:GAF domain-containing protein n=1 Tax=Alsobacter ponti TaxID=2962936 RepID=A0ABT1LEG0_9HYPH|nr:GAF domain-containing protein [Alsobacter ponti]MCP8939844.1 GAF domain-containing protein [Alsobacter ponti]
MPQSQSLVTEAQLATFDAELGAATTPEACWTALRRLAQASIGARLFTVMEIDNVREVAGRVYTSDPVAYPVSGTKPLRYDAWFDQVHRQKRPFVANTIADIARVFPDHELIWSLGCGSVVNMPIEIGGKVVGTMNALDAEHHYDEARVAAAARLRLPAKAAWLCARHWANAPA